MTELEPPTERECQRCSRRETWDDEATNWTIPDDAKTGEPFCIHEWDITGAYRPVRE